MGAAQELSSGPGNWIMLLLFGVALLVAAAVMLYYRRSMLADAARMHSVETSRAADVASKLQGSLVEVKGILQCDQPLKSELSQTLCAHAVVSVTREYKSRRSQSGGRSYSERRSEVVSTNTVCADFAVEDESGRATVDPSHGATIEGRESVNRFEPHTGDGVIGVINAIAGGEQTLGDRHTETILPLGARVYVMGVVRADGVIGAPASGATDQGFGISVRTEEERTAELAGWSRWLLWGAIGCGALALLFFAIAVSIAN